MMMMTVIKIIDVEIGTLMVCLKLKNALQNHLVAVRLWILRVRLNTM